MAIARARQDFYATAELFRLGKPRHVEQWLENVDQPLQQWRAFAAQATVAEQCIEQISAHHRRLKDLL